MVGYILGKTSSMELCFHQLQTRISEEVPYVVDVNLVCVVLGKGTSKDISPQCICASVLQTFFRCGLFLLARVLVSTNTMS